MQKRQEYVALEITSEKLDGIVAAIRDRLLAEFWAHVPAGPHRDEIGARLEDSILAALAHPPGDIEAT
jgi:hypothetical protein